ncbi:MAG: (2Fe-2S) ferredoxin domain-containing protein [Rhodospirillaceae bacterium]
MGRCNFGPTVRIAPGGAFHLGMAPEEIPGFLDRLEQNLDLTRNPIILNKLPTIGS